MFSNVVTLFNYDESAQKYYALVLTEVELQSHYRTSFDEDSTNIGDVSLLIVRYYLDGGNKKIVGSDKVYRPIKAWNDLGNKDGYFTIQPGRDFFAKGECTELAEMTYEEIKNAKDDVFFVQSVKEFEDELKHWEIEGY